MKKTRNSPKRKRKLREPNSESSDKNDSGSSLLPAIVGAVLGNVIAPGIGGIVIGGLTGAAIGSSTNGDKQMARIPVFYSFHFDNDVMRVQQVRNIGTIEGNAPTSPNDWEQLKRSGKTAVENWIDQNMKHKRCVIVLIGTETANRQWIKYEIEKAWNDGKALLGIHIHNLRCPRNGVARKGRNPFDDFQFNSGAKLSSAVPCYDPNPANAYQEIASNISSWITTAIANKRN